jgi:hypothetical protein
MKRIVSVAAIVGLAGLSAVPARADHNGNVQIVSLARQLAQQAQSVVYQAQSVVGWGYGDWTDRQALESLRSFARYAESLHHRAAQMEPGSGSPLPPHSAALGARGLHVSTRDHNDENIGHQLRQLFSRTWSEADRVESYLYRSYRLAYSQARSSWDYQVCSTLRQLRGAFGGQPWAARDDVRSARFDELHAAAR